MRSITASALCALSAAVFLLTTPAYADDNKPPVISEVKASSKGSSTLIEAKITDETGVLQATVFYRKGGSKWSEQVMTKNDYDDTFKATLSGGAEEYYIQATDLLGNGPSSYGAAAKPMALGGGHKPTAVAANEPPPEPKQPKEPPPPPEPKEPREPKEHHHHAEAPKAKAPPPTIEHHHLSATPPEGTAFTLRIRIHAEAGIKTAALYARPVGFGGWKITIPLVHGDGDSWSVELPAAITHGDLEYLIAAKDNDDQQVNQGDGSASTPYRISFKPVEPVATGPVAQVFTISHASPFRLEPGKAIQLRAQVSPGNIDSITDAQAADAEAKVAAAKVQLLYRGQDANDQVVDMVADPSGGLGGFVAELPAQAEGEVLHYQIVACGPDGCAIDTGSKKKWNGLTISSSPASAPPTIDAVSSKAPPGLPE